MTFVVSVFLRLILVTYDRSPFTRGQARLEQSGEFVPVLHPYTPQGSTVPLFTGVQHGVVIK